MKRAAHVTTAAVVFLVFLAAFTVDVGAQTSGLKVGYVNLSQVFDQYSKTAQYDKTLEAKNEQYKIERNAKLEKIQDSERKVVLMKEDQRADLLKQIEKDKNDLLEYDRQKQTDLRKERDEKIREILLEIEKVVKAYADKEKFDLILNDRVLIFGSKALDLTETILKELNSAQPASKK